MKRISFKILLVTLVFFSISLNVKSQTPEEALRYSRLNYTASTARSAGMGGAFGALGGDFSTLSTNPAGLGIFRTSEFNFTPSVTFMKSETDYLGNVYKDDKSKFKLGNFGYIAPIRTPNLEKSVGIKYINFGLGVNKHNDFGNIFKMKGFNESSSITSAWVNEANSNNPNIIIPDEGDPELVGLDPFSTELGWETFLLDWDVDENGNAFIFSDMEGGKVDQEIVMETLGSMNEFVLSTGFNWQDKIYAGITLGIPYFNYYEYFQIYEEDSEDINFFFNNMTYRTTLKTSGNGVNFKAGLIYQPTNWLRVGAAIHTPTKYNMFDYYEAEVNSNLTFLDSLNMPYDVSNTAYKNMQLSYTLRTPMRLLFNSAIILGQHGVLSVDYIFQDYSNAVYKHSNYSFDETNQLIDYNYKPSHTVNIGTEWVLGFLRLRAGYGFETSPYKSNDVNTGGNRHHISTGIGLRFNSFYTDFAYVYNSEKFDFYPYNRTFVNPSHNKYNMNQIQMTFGLKF
jgi:long-subunit fatty acid transport protein